MNKSSRHFLKRPDTLDRGETARLVPVAAESNKEVKAASIFLATLMAVPPFAKEVLSTINQNVGARTSLRCFTEVRFKKEKKDTNLRPDGLILLNSGRGKTWNCLVEAKVGNAELEALQVENYLSLAKRNNVQAVLTISNQFVARPDHPPVKISKNSLRSTGLYHWSWSYLLSAAKLLLDDGDFETKEQRYILQEFVRYLSHSSSGASRFDRMNSEWREVCSQVIARATLNKASLTVENTVAAWHQETRDICLLMSEKLSRPVRLYLSRTHTKDPELRMKNDCEHLVRSFELKCILDIPDAASPLAATANLETRVIVVSMTLDAPKDKQRATSRVNWLLRQLAKSDPEDIYIKSNWSGRVPPTQARLSDLRENPEILVMENNGAPVSFDVLLVRDIAGKFSGRKTFIEQLEQAVPHFYSEVGQHLRAYIPAAPPISEKESEPKPEDPVRVEVSVTPAPSGAEITSSLEDIAENSVEPQS